MSKLTSSILSFTTTYFASIDDILLNQRLPQAFAQIGFISILLGLVGAWMSIRKQHEHLIWLIVTLLFFWLSLGSIIIFDKIVLDGFPNLYPILLNNPVFCSLTRTLSLSDYHDFWLVDLVVAGCVWSISAISQTDCLYDLFAYRSLDVV